MSDSRFVVTQVAIDCLSLLSPSISMPTYLQTTFPFDDSYQTQEDIFQNIIDFTSWDDHFGTVNNACLIASCELKSSLNGGTTWTLQSSLDNVYMDGFTIKAKRNVPEGYSSEFKVEC